MSRKHFILLAAALRAHRGVCLGMEIPSCDDLIRSVAVVCAACNKEFSFDRFYSAANYKGLNDARNEIRTETDCRESA